MTRGDARSVIHQSLTTKRPYHEEPVASRVTEIAQPTMGLTKERLADYAKVAKRGQETNLLKGGIPTPVPNVNGKLPNGTWEASVVSAAPVARWRVARVGGTLTTELVMREGVMPTKARMI